MKHVHILGIGGTFMGGVAALAREQGYRVTGSDAKLYPPMSTQLEALGIPVLPGYDPSHLDPAPDLVVIGNALSRGNPEVEAILDRGLPHTSGPAWLREHVLRGRRVIAVAGTHGKTTTASLIAWILEANGLAPGFLVGGVPGNFDVSARRGDSPWFVVEADEYDTAFFDKRSKFVHYGPEIAVLNNLEFDHADIFASVEEIERQFHHLVRTVPGRGRVIANGDDLHLARVLAMGCWTPVEYFHVAQPPADAAHRHWWGEPEAADHTRFTVRASDGRSAPVAWSCPGRHNMWNALAAVAACTPAGIDPAGASRALERFRAPRRRLDLLGRPDGIAIYEDFAHHPTAIRETLAALRSQPVAGRLVAVFEPRSNSMRMGVFGDRLATAFAGADLVYLLEPPDLRWNPGRVLDAIGTHARAAPSVDGLLEHLAGELRPGDLAVIMSNGDFGGLARRLVSSLDNRARRSRPEPRAAGRL